MAFRSVPHVHGHLRYFLSIAILCNIFRHALCQEAFGNENDAATFGSAERVHENAAAAMPAISRSYPAGAGPSFENQFGVDDDEIDQETEGVLTREKHFDGQVHQANYDSESAPEGGSAFSGENRRHRPMVHRPDDSSESQPQPDPRRYHQSQPDDQLGGGNGGYVPVASQRGLYQQRGQNMQAANMGGNQMETQQIASDPNELGQMMAQADRAQRQQQHQEQQYHAPPPVIPPGSDVTVHGPGWASMDIPMKPNVPIPDGIQDQGMNPNYRKYFGELDDQIAFQLPNLHVNCWLQSMMSSVWGFSPSCNEDGTYGPKQCHQKRCWCVNHSGVKIKHHGGKLDDGYYFGLRGLTLFCSEN